jgi:hypothetical protein
MEPLGRVSVLILLSACCALGLATLNMTRDGLENGFDRVHLGMSRGQVREVFGQVDGLPICPAVVTSSESECWFRSSVYVYRITFSPRTDAVYSKQAIPRRHHSTLDRIGCFLFRFHRGERY